MTTTFDALSLFSGGLDSILATRTVMDQGLKVLGIHFVTPFFGKPHLIPFWQDHYGVEVQAVDISPQYVDMIVDGPPNAFGKQLNPCVDCKVLMLTEAKKLLGAYSAKILISGEVVGQRPMSQRPDALNLIRKSADVSDVLLRPLCARKLEITPVEEAGLVDRSRLLDLYGRNRKPQLDLARNKYGFTEIPTPAGGCVLAEIEAAARFWYLLRASEAVGVRPSPDDFTLAQTGRQLWTTKDAADLWLCIGRNREDNDKLAFQAKDTDLLFKLVDFPGPTALARPMSGAPWSTEAVRDAAALVASYAPRAVKSGEEVAVAVTTGPTTTTVHVLPQRTSSLGFCEPNRKGFRQWKAARLPG
ncbi:MAG: tRNA(5-methylaminomethyl-2-thiouridylate) methyltransferase [Proteobacteria bacterium]|nr:tRNA(5-methylaminomethyl-2-thiouridylate) methyltransferase [Pseudomonadota bacterium]MBU1610657.1 tRNA(5-methylaminomethyl-2-thiouridylate) methyltransferase [Pseudomonadota bacterium]